jgi:hypothetical protein
LRSVDICEVCDISSGGYELTVYFWSVLILKEEHVGLPTRLEGAIANPGFAERYFELLKDAKVKGYLFAQQNYIPKDE